MFCKKCGKAVPEGSKFCPSCGASLVEDFYTSYSSYCSVSDLDLNVSPKSRLIAALLAIFLGFFGVHRFYVDKAGTGILQILLTFCGGIGVIWAFVDFIIILVGGFKDKEGRVVKNWDLH